MKRSTYLLAALLAATLLSAPAWATNPKPPTTPTPATQPIDIDASAAAGAAAHAGAAAGAVSGSLSGSVSNAQTGASTSTAAGGHATGGNASGGEASAGSYSAGGGGGSGGALADNSSNRMYVLPAPVWSSVPQAAGCIVTNSTAGAFGWNLISASRSTQGSDPVCVGVIMAKAAYDHCHFESEQLITARIYETIFPGAPALPVVPGTRNLSLAECEAIKNPRLVMAPSIAPVVHVPAPAPTPVAVTCVAPPAAQVHTPARKPVQRKAAPAACPR